MEVADVEAQLRSDDHSLVGGRVGNRVFRRRGQEPVPAAPAVQLTGGLGEARLLLHVQGAQLVGAQPALAG